MAKRLTGPFLQHILQQFNDGHIDRAEAAQQLQIRSAHLYRRRTRWLQNRPQLSGGGHWPVWDKALAAQRSAIRPCPPTTLLDLHLALQLRRRVNADFQINFLGRSWPIAPTKRATVTLIHHPQRQFWAVTQPPQPPHNIWPEILGNYSL